MAKIAVAQIEYQEGGRAIWVHDPQGVTVMRIQCTGEIKTQAVEQLHSSSHIIELNVVGNITVLKSKKRKKK